MPEKLRKWKAELAHSDLVDAMLTEVPGLVSESNDAMEDEDPPRPDVRPRGYHEFVDGELRMIDNEDVDSRFARDDEDE